MAVRFTVTALGSAGGRTAGQVVGDIVRYLEPRPVQATGPSPAAPAVPSGDGPSSYLRLRRRLALACDHATPPEPEMRCRARDSTASGDSREGLVSTTSPSSALSSTRAPTAP